MSSALQKCLDEEKNNEYNHIEESIKNLQKCLLENGDANYCYDNYRDDLHNLHINPMFTNSVQKLDDCLKKNMPNTFTKKPEKTVRDNRYFYTFLMLGIVLVFLLLGYLVYDYLLNLDVYFDTEGMFSSQGEIDAYNKGQARKARRQAREQVREQVREQEKEDSKKPLSAKEIDNKIQSEMFKEWWSRM